MTPDCEPLPLAPLQLMLYVPHDGVHATVAELFVMLIGVTTGVDDTLMKTVLDDIVGHPGGCVKTCTYCVEVIPVIVTDGNPKPPVETHGPNGLVAACHE